MNAQANKEDDEDEDDDLEALEEMNEAVIDHQAMSDLIAFLRFAN